MLVPEEPVGRGAPVSNVIEEDLQLVVVVKVCSNNSSNRGWHGKLLGCYVLEKKVTLVKHVSAYTEAQMCQSMKTFPYIHQSLQGPFL